MADARKRPCCICRRWFRPDPRIGSRQRACGRPECQVARRKKKQKAWRERNPDYFIARRIQDQPARSTAGTTASAHSLKPTSLGHRANPIWRNAWQRSMSMLSQSQRATILELHSQGVSKREIARVLNISRLSVRKVLRSKSSALPALVRPEKAEAYRVQILELLASHKGGADGLLPASWYRPGTEDRFRSISLPARNCSMTRRHTRRKSGARNARSRPPQPCCATRG